MRVGNVVGYARLSSLFSLLAGLFLASRGHGRKTRVHFRCVIQFCLKVRYVLCVGDEAESDSSMATGKRFSYD